MKKHEFYPSLLPLPKPKPCKRITHPILIERDEEELEEYVERVERELGLPHRSACQAACENALSEEGKQPKKRQKRTQQDIFNRYIELTMSDPPEEVRVALETLPETTVVEIWKKEAAIPSKEELSMSQDDNDEDFTRFLRSMELGIARDISESMHSNHTQEVPSDD